MTIKLQDIYGLAKADVLPAGGTADQVLSKIDGTDGNVRWTDVSGGLDWQTDQAADFTAVAGNGYPIHGGVTMTLPAAPTDGDQVAFKDFNNDFDTTNATINPNGNNLEQLGTGNLTLDGKGLGGILTWVKDRWLVTNITGSVNGINKTSTDAGYFMQVQDQKPTGTDGSNSVIGDNQRDLNTVVVNEISGASLNANEVTLPAGTYYIECLIKSYFIYNAQFNVVHIRKADNTSLIIGPSTDCHEGKIAQAAGKIVLSGTTKIKVVTVFTMVSAKGLGNASNQGPYEVYADLRIWQLST